MKFEKGHYDLSRLLTRPQYFDCKFMFRSSLELRATEYVGHFHRNLGEGFSLNGCDSDYSFGISIEIDGSLKNGKEYSTQLVCLFTDIFGSTYLRLINFSIKANESITNFYESIDVDTLTKLSVVKEINRCYSTKNFNQSDEYLTERIVKHLAHYREKCSTETSKTQLVIPIKTRFYPLYMHSFLKKPPMLANKKNVGTNQVTASIDKMLRMPTYNLIKYIYPRLYRVDDLDQDQMHKRAKLQLTPPTELGCYNEQLKSYTKPNLEIPMYDKIEFSS